MKQLGISLIALIALVGIVLAAATIWLFLTNPVTVASAVSEGEISPPARSLAEVLFNALSGLRKYWSVRVPFSGISPESNRRRT